MFKFLKRIRKGENDSETIPLTPPDSPSTSHDHRQQNRNYGSIVRLLRKTLSSHPHHQVHFYSYQLTECVKRLAISDIENIFFQLSSTFSIIFTCGW